ncbi:aminotransferase class I/II-fold pyridoxal phosphate-dependent enzyme [Streptomyces sp. NRRL S-1521]|uniref:aminotransferase class I/II-fold pyridoxal phosphate-dependent enzyme n=1 Tax=Streptomyces sp. NRRL S-1521 TaxID=1609100 RepID=UPI00099E6F81|nr:aminotransferase class I/II-fold pyridoxal phosphate-dependent enzyme [Streptomyces sp. NRRL S-1521]
MEQGLDTNPSPPGRSSAAAADVLALVESRVRSRSLGGGRTPALWTRAIDALDGMTLQYRDEPPQTAMTSYDYLGLLGHPAIDEGAKAAIEKYGTGGHGTAAAAASLTSHRHLEERLAAFTGHEGAILLPSGFQTNATAIPALVGKGDWIFSDDLNHASIVAGCSLASARGAHVRTFRHNDPAHVRSLLSEAPDDVVKLVVCDAVFSADGDLLDLPAFDKACREHRAVLYLDEAHSLGVLGETGKGLHEHFGVVRSPLGLTMATLSKTVPSAGGFLAGPASLTRLLRLAASGHVFSAALPAMACGAAIAALDVIEDEGAERRERLRSNIRHFVEGARRIGLVTPEQGPYHTGIVPLLVGDDQRAMRIAEYCRRRGVMVVPFIWPAVVHDAARLRVNVTARHSTAQLDQALSTFAAAFREV